MGHVRKHSAVSPGRRARRLVGLLLWPTALLPGLAAAEDWNRNLRWSLDYSIDAQDVSGGRDGSGRLHFLGIDSHNTFRRDGRNAVTTIFQLYAAKTDGLVRYPGFFDSDDDWELVPKIISANFHVSGDGRFNVLVGRPEILYGLEASIDTAGTLRQLITAPNIGLKADWGVGINGEGRRLRYDLTLTRGSGLKYRRGGDPWAVTGRIGTAGGDQAFFGTTGAGFSFFSGNVRLPNGRFIERRRVGIDGQWYRGPLGLMTEISVGEDDDADVVAGFAELNLVSRNTRFASYGQARLFRKKPLSTWQDQKSWALGVRYMPTRRLSFAVQYLRETEILAPRGEETVFQLQMRYRNQQ
jgi:hypothetical protein